MLTKEQPTSHGHHNRGLVKDHLEFIRKYFERAE
jgi:hypothetical protein